MGLKEKIEEVAEGLEGTLGVAVKHLGTGEEVLINGDELFWMASTFKVPVIVTLYREMDGGKVSLDEKLVMTEYARVPGSGIIQQLTPGLEMTVRDYRTLMMIISDNTATDMMVELVGKENVNKTMLQLGLKKTNISTCREILFETAGLSDIPSKDRTYKLYHEKARQRRAERGPRKVERTLNNTTTPRDMMFLLEKLYRGEVASRSSCDEIIDLMKRCQTGENRLRKYLPRDEVEVAHKTGTVSGVVNDVGIVFPRGESPYIICCLAKDLTNHSAGEEAIATVSKIVYDYFTSGGT